MSCFILLLSDPLFLLLFLFLVLARFAESLKLRPPTGGHTGWTVGPVSNSNTALPPRVEMTKGQGKRPAFNIPTASFAAPPPPASGGSPIGVGTDEFQFKDQVLSSGPVEMQVGGKRITASFDDIVRIAARGRGIHGAVYEVNIKDQGGESFAMKEIELQHTDAASCAQIVRELEILKRGSSCPFIVDFLAAFYKECTICILMEYMNLGSWNKILKRPGIGKIPEDIMAQVAVATLGGLQFLKDELNIIHRDIKPSNILCNTAGEIKVCDFSVSGELHKSKAGTYTGTFYYMAPERIQPAKSKEYDVRSDVWSLGVTLVEIGIGAYPYPKETSVYAMLNHIVNGPTPIEMEPFKNAGFSPEFVSFCERCFGKAVTDRSTNKELMEDPFAAVPANPARVTAWLSEKGQLNVPLRAPVTPQGSEEGGWP
jgi:serine/threonine protein kinase